MWLDNYYKLQYVYTAYSSRIDDQRCVDMSSNPIKATSGTNMLYVTSGYPYIYTAASKPRNSVRSQTDHSGYTLDTPDLIIGSGTTPATGSDYRLESQITALTSSVVTSEYNARNGTLTHRKTMVNTSGSQITVSEIGILSGGNSHSSLTSNSTTHLAVLVYREVLENPIVVGAGETFTVTITHKLPMPG